MITDLNELLRLCPFAVESVPIIQNYLNSCFKGGFIDTSRWLFLNHMKETFTRQGVNHLISKYRDLARVTHPDLIPDDLSPHKMRNPNLNKIQTFCQHSTPYKYSASRKF